MITAAGSGHPGGSLSTVELLASLYANHLNHRAEGSNEFDKDRFILSKGHGVPALYAVLSRHGYLDQSQLITLRKLGSPLQGHPVRGTIPGIEACTGSLGQGLSIALGIALAQRLARQDRRVYCLMGDGEIQEGQVWEAAMCAGKYQTDNLVAIVDLNKAQIDGLVEHVMPIEPMEGKWESFGWIAKRIDGHDLKAVNDALLWSKVKENKPKVILANTIKGRGVSFMESELVKWHGVAPTQAQLEQALGELKTN